NVPRSLTLSGTWASFDRQMIEMFRARADVLEFAGAEPYQRLTHALGYPAEWMAAHERDLASAVKSAEAVLSPRSVALQRIRMLERTDRSTELGSIQTPSLVIAALDDPLIPFSQSRLLAR